MYDSYLSYSGFQNARGCLYRYWHTYKGHTQHPPEDRLGSVYGTVVGRLFETFFKDRLWLRPGASDALMTLAAPTVDGVLHEEENPRKGRPGGYHRWRPELYATRDDLVSDVRAAIPRGLSTIKLYRLIGLNVKTELKLDSTIEGHRVAGRADFVMVRIPPHRDLVIIDGKGSRKRDRYTDVRQLHWYALLYRERHGHLPDQGAFLYWHYDPPSNIDWCPIDAAAIDELKGQIVSVMDDLLARSRQVGDAKSLPMVQSVFSPSPKIANCRFCPFATPEICPRGHDVVQKAEAQAQARETHGKPRTDPSTC